MKLPLLTGLMERRYQVNDQRLHSRLFGIDFDNPVGLAAGFDKNGLWFNSLRNLGFGHIEIGTLTAHAQPGNPKPRMFRLLKDQALINRMGFNNKGSAWAATRLSKQTMNSKVGINIGKSKVTELQDASDDYHQSFQRLFPFATYFTINVSSPNTPGLRDLQNRADLEQIISLLQTSNLELSKKHSLPVRPILLKIAPDLSDSQLMEIAEMSLECQLDGIIATNTTIARDNLLTDKSKLEKIGNGGLSGRPLTLRSRQVVSLLFERIKGKIPIVGCGGIMNGEDAWNLIGCGASLVQVYTGFIYAGPGFIRDVNRYLLDRMQKDGIDSISHYVGQNPV